VASVPMPLSLQVASVSDAEVTGAGNAEDEDDELGPVPSMRYSAKSITARLEATR
jgi:hypothetical protein